jgi:hypothetical protein
MNQQATSTGVATRSVATTAPATGRISDVSRNEEEDRKSPYPEWANDWDDTLVDVSRYLI